MNLKFKILSFCILGIIFQIQSQCPPPGGDYRLPTQDHVDSFLSEYPDCDQIDGNLTIGEYVQPISRDISDISGFVNLKRVTGDLRIREADQLESLEGLQNLEFVGGDLRIGRNDLLPDLYMLSKLDSIGDDLRINSNYNITSIFQNDNLDFIGGSVLITFNTILSSTAGFGNLNTVLGNLEITHCMMLENFDGFENLSTINGNLEVFNTGISDFTDLSNFQGSVSSINIGDNQNLIGLNGLENLDSIAGTMKIIGNTNLESLQSLNGLNYVGGFFEVSESAIPDFSGLENLVLGNGSITIKDNLDLTSISQLEINSKIQGSLRMDGNENLTDISSLLPIDSIFGGLSIVKNSSLSDCGSVCQLLKDGFVENTVSVYGNLDGCNSIVEITEMECVTDVQEILTDSDLISVSPNPVYNILSISFQQEVPNNLSLTLYNSIGQQQIKESIQSNHSQNHAVDMTSLTPGIYFLLVEYEGGKVIEKIVRQK